MKKTTICYLVIIAMFMALFRPPAYAQSDDQEFKIKEARLYLDGKVRPYNPSKSFQLFKECALLGNLEAMNVLGNMFNEGIGTEKNLSLAKEWFQKASDAGYSKASFNLGTFYMYGQEAEPDFEMAYMNFKRQPS